MDQRVAGHLIGKSGAAIAEDASLTIEEHEIADRDRLLEMPLLLDVPTLTRTVAERLVLQRALAALVADGAVERVVGEQQLDDALLGPLGRRRLRFDLHVGGDGDHARRLEHRAATGVDLDEAHAAHAHRRHPLVVTEARDVHVVALGRGDDQLALASRDGLAVDRDRDSVRVRRRLLRGSVRCRRHAAPPAARCVAVACS